MYTTKRKGNDGRTYVGANINNRQFEMKLPKILMSKGMGKVLDSKMAKKVMIPVGNMAIKAMKAPMKMMSNAMMKEKEMAKKKDDYYRANAPVGVYGGTNMGEYKLPSNVKRK